MGKYESLRCDTNLCALRSASMRAHTNVRLACACRTGHASADVVEQHFPLVGSAHGRGDREVLPDQHGSHGRDEVAVDGGELLRDLLGGPVHEHEAEDEAEAEDDGHGRVAQLLQRVDRVLRLAAVAAGNVVNDGKQDERGQNRAEETLPAHELERVDLSAADGLKHTKTHTQKGQTESKEK